MAEVKNVQMIVLDNKVKVSGQLKFAPNEVGQNYRVKIEIFADDTGGTQFNLGPLYTFRFGESETTLHPVGSLPPLAALFKTITAAPTVNIDETDKLDTAKLDEDPGFYTKETPNGPIALPNADEVFAVISVLSANGSTTLVKGRSETLTGVF